MRLVSLFQAFCHAVPSQVHRPTVEDATLWHDAEFQMMMRELRYPPIRRSRDSRVRIAVYRDPGRHRNR